MIYVLLQLRNYLIIVKAASDKHFALEDNGAYEVASGNWYDMLQMCEERETMLADDLIELKTSTSLIQTTDECLRIILDLNPDFLNNKTFVE